MKMLLNKVIWKRKYRNHFLIAGIGFGVGLYILLLTLQFYGDFHALYSTQFSAKKQVDYLVVNKKVRSLFSLTPNTGFSQQEIGELENQDYIQSVGKILSNRFSASALITFGAASYGTELFFEALPDSYLKDNLEGNLEEWQWQEGDNFLPVIISRDFLALYNFGFATPRGLPLLTPQTLQAIPFQVVITGPGGKRRYDARVVALTDLLSTILVPYSFLEWSNIHIGGQADAAPLRLILAVKERSDPRLFQFFKKKGYETGQHALGLSAARSFIQLLFLFLTVLGLAFLVLAMVIFVTSFQLILARVTDEITLLLDLGYTPNAIVARFIKTLARILLITGGVVLLFSVLTISGSHALLNRLGIFDFKSIHPLIYVLLLLLISLSLFTNYAALRSGLKKQYAGKRHVRG